MNPITKETVRIAMLAAQGLLSPPDMPAKKGHLLPIIQQMGYLQIDTIQVVRRSQNLVLWSRLGDHDLGWLDEVHAEGSLFEYYAHALCYLPIGDYPIFRGLILNDDRTGNNRQNWAQDHPEILAKVRSVIEASGPVSSSDFASKTIATGWGDVKQEKLALERMFASGELMVAYREKFRRFFDLQERVLPNWDDADALDAVSAHEALVLKAIRALGVAREDWIAPYYYLLKTGLPQVLADLAAQERIIKVQVSGWETPAYIHPDHLEMVRSAAEGDLIPSHTTFLSPFDPLVSDRDRALALFDFDYRMESYTPVKDRKFGYFCLPILHNGRLVGRMDPKAHRREKRLEIKNLYLEEGVVVDDELVAALKETLAQFATWHEMESVEITASDPSDLKEVLV